MVQEFKYTQDPNAAVPRMFIDNEIGNGVDTDGRPLISGSQFLKELFCLSDEMGKRSIEVWINSPGGLVMDGMSIYTAILDCKANVDTHCYGVAASIAGVIFQAGKKRIMKDFAKLMFHPAFNADGKIDKGLDAMNDSVITMISNRTGKTEEEVWQVMNAGRRDDKGTWMDSDYAAKNGFCDEVEISSDKNTSRKILNETGLTATWKAANLVFNRLIEKPKTHKMKQVCNKLGLNEDANEASIMQAIADIEAKNKTSLETLKTDNEKKESELTEMKKKVDDLNKEKGELEAKIKATEDEAVVKAAAELEETSINAINAAVSAGKIKNEAALIDQWKNSYKANPEATKSLLESLSPTKIAPKFTPTNTGDIKDSAAESVARAAGHKPGTAQWYNAIKVAELQTSK